MNIFKMKIADKLFSFLLVNTLITNQLNYLFSDKIKIIEDSKYFIL